jgi:hypothetical protein
MQNYFFQNQALARVRLGVFFPHIAKRKTLKFKQLFKFCLIISIGFTVQHSFGQTTGTVFRDYDGDGYRDSILNSFVEQRVGGVIVNAYNSSDVLVASYVTPQNGKFSIPLSGTSYNGIIGSNTGYVASSTSIRLEFVIPTNSSDIGHISPTYDFSSSTGATYGSSIRFITSGSTGNDYAINNPNDFVSDTTNSNNTIYQAIQQNGNPAGGGTSASRIAFAKFPYSSSGSGTRTTPLTTSQTLATIQQIGSVFGVAYSKKAQKVFTSAYIKRHCGLGPANGTFNNAPGAIYIIDPSLHSTSSPTVAASYFISLDALGYPTHNSTGVPAYGNGSSYTISSGGTGSTRYESISYIGEGWAVVGENSSSYRNLPANYNTQNNDPAAFGQVGRVGLGDIDISDDGQYLFVTNLYDRKIYQLQLNSITNPTSASVVASFALPNPPLRSESGIPYAAATYNGTNDNTDFYTGLRGLQRPFGLKYYRGKLYVSAVTTGEGTSGSTTTDNGLSNPEYTDLWAYVWQLDPLSGFNSTPTLQFPLNYDRGTNDDGYNETFELWDNDLPAPTHISLLLIHHAQPILSDIEFDDEGSMILSIRDRFGDQIGYQNYMMSSTDLRSAWALGDILRAYYNTSNGQYEIEFNAKEGINSLKSATLGTFSYQGPNAGEFYFEDGLEKYNGTSQNVRYHKNVTMGSSAISTGKNEVTVTTMDPMDIWSGGVSWFSNTNGTNKRDYELYYGQTVGLFGKANGLGDIELLGSNAPIEIGNRVWNDSDADGIQDAGESGFSNVTVQLYTNGIDGIAGNGDDVSAGSITTNSNGNFYFTTRSGTDGGGVDYGVSISPNTAYNLRIGSADWSTGTSAGIGDLASKYLTQTNITGNGETDQSDNDALLNSSNYPMISFTTGNYGENNHSYDFGFSPPYGNLGNRVWFDQNANGQFDENSSAGLNGVTVELYKETSSGSGVFSLVASTITANDDSDLPGYYNFVILTAANYRVKFIYPYAPASIQTTTVATDNNSDPNAADGLTQIIAMDPSGSSFAKNNYTIDAGFKNLEIGDYVWLDTDADGIQDDDESGISGVALDLYDANGNQIQICKSDNESTDFSSTTDNDGSFNFGSDWILSGTGTTITGGELQVSGQTGIAKRDVSKPNIYSVDSVLITFDLKKSVGIITSETFVIEYHNGTSWNTLASLTGTNILSTSSYTNFKYSSLTRSGYTTVAGISNIDSIRFKEGAYDNADVIYVDNLNITFKKSCTNATTTTDANGWYSFNVLNHNIAANTNYQIRIQEAQSSVSNLIVTGTGAGISANDNNGTDGGSYTTSGIFTTPIYGSDLSLDFGFKGYSIGNAVWWDNDNDGVKDAGEIGIGGISLSLLNSSGIEIATTTTDKNGNYSFNGLPSGIYQVAITNSLTEGILAGATLPSATLTDDVDNNNNGNASYSSGNTPNITYSAISDTITLKSRLEPTNETDEDDIASQPDNMSNLTVDFGFYSLNIGNYVWLDEDADGIQDAIEPDIEGVELDLYSSGGSLVYVGCNTKTVSTDMSSSSHNSGTKNFDGNWSFAGTSTGLNSGLLRVYGTTGSSATRNINQPSNYSIDTVRISLNLYQSGVSKTENFKIEYYDSTISTWVTLTELYGLTDAVGSIETTSRTYTFNSIHFPGLLNIAGIRFSEGSAGYANTDIVYVDNLSIVFSEGCAPAQAVTDTNGYYNFNSYIHGLSPSTTYQLRIPEIQSKLTGLVATSTGQGTSSTDNNGTDAGTYITSGSITSPSSGQNHTFDFGFYPVSIGNFVWMDADADGIQDDDEAGIEGVEIGLFYTSGDAAGCGSDNVSTDFSSSSHNSGSINFTGDWALVSGASIASGELVMSDQDSARRYITQPSSYSSDSIILSFGLKKNASIDATDKLRIEYNNGTSWDTIATISGSSILSTSSFNTFTYSSLSIPGLLNIKGIRFAEHTGISSTEFIYVDNLNIRFSETCNPISTITDASGYYNFDLNDGLTANTNYQIRIEEAQPNINDLSATITGGGTASTDNNGSDAGSYISSSSLTSPTTGTNTTYDFGLIGYSIGNTVWWDNDADGIKDNGEIGISDINVSLLNSDGVEIKTTTTDETGKYYFGGLIAGSYQVAITSLLNSGLLNGASIPATTTTADIDNNNNGSADNPLGFGHTNILFSSISELVILGAKTEPTNETDEDPTTNQPDNQSNLTIDFGFVPPPTAIGNFVYRDKNMDGDYDALSGTPDIGVDGVKVYLYQDLNNDAVAETKMDSITTANGGFYEFTNIGAGVFKLTIAPSNFLSGGSLYNTTSYVNGQAGDTMTDNNSEGINSGNIWLIPNLQNTIDAGDEDLQGIGDNDANFSFDFGFEGGVLPVTWLSFNAKLINYEADALLNWATASEVNNKYFEIERSYDAQNFEIIGKMNSKAIGGNSNTLLSYQFYDHDFDHSFKTIYYRLKQHDLNGKTNYSEIRFVTLAHNTAITLYPNPATNNATLIIDNNRYGASFNIYSIDGRLIRSESLTPKTTSYKIVLDGLAAGSYIITVITDSEVIKLSLIKN